MGYTHYWYVKRNADVRRIDRTVVEMAAVVQQSDLLAGWDGEGKPEIAEGLIRFNGIGPDDDHETFTFPPDLNEEPPPYREDKNTIFSFCKTACKPYDPVVTACLAIAADIMGDDIEVSSDGDGDDWREGVALASQATGRDIANPVA